MKKPLLRNADGREFEPSRRHVNSLDKESNRRQSNIGIVPEWNRHALGMKQVAGSIPGTVPDIPQSLRLLGSLQGWGIYGLKQKLCEKNYTFEHSARVFDSDPVNAYAADTEHKLKTGLKLKTCFIPHITFSWGRNLRKIR